jgi:hypothetical protein
MPLPDTTVCRVKGADGVEFHATSRNQHGTGFDIIVSNPIAGNVDILIYQVVCHEVPIEPSVSLTMEAISASNFLIAVQAGVSIAFHTARHSKFH